ncbi:MAG: ester cyclase [Rubrobacter sp.]|nr:ester cyclase [Rubrobacter sp.]
MATPYAPRSPVDDGRRGRAESSAFTLHLSPCSLFWGISPTGRRIAVQHVYWWRFANGKVVEYWAVRDDLGMLQQLGVVPMLRNS